eukprot:3319654-Amphidinium_carterae.1
MNDLQNLSGPLRRRRSSNTVTSSAIGTQQLRARGVHVSGCAGGIQRNPALSVEITELLAQLRQD